MTDQTGKFSRRVLDPNARLSEALFGLIMVLTFTCSLSVVGSGREDVREMLIGALGCNFAWGVIDGIFYLMGCLGEKGLGLRARRALRNAGTAEAAHRVIADALPPRVCKTVALPKPNERESSQWYFQRYVPHLPAAGELVLFDRSWYNRAGVETVMGYCSPAETARFLLGPESSAITGDVLMVDSGYHVMGI